MASENLGFDIRETTKDEALFLELVVEGSIIARASANVQTLDELQEKLGLDRDAVRRDLRRALLDTLKSQGQFVEITDISEVPDRRLRFSGRFTHSLRSQVSMGLVWYDVNTSTTGPEELPAVVRNKMRFEVHRKLTQAGSAARALVDLHK